MISSILAFKFDESESTFDVSVARKIKDTEIKFCHLAVIQRRQCFQRNFDGSE